MKKSAKSRVKASFYINQQTLIKDQERMLDIIADSMYEEDSNYKIAASMTYGFAVTKDNVNEAINSGYIPWTLDKKGIIFYVNLVNGSTQRIRINFSDEPQLFDSKYIEEDEDYIIPLSTLADYKEGLSEYGLDEFNDIDLDGDGKPDTVNLDVQSDGYGGYDGFYIEFNQERTIQEIIGYDISAYVMKGAGDKYYIYVISVGENEHSTIYIYDFDNGQNSLVDKLEDTSLKYLWTEQRGDNTEIITTPSCFSLDSWTDGEFINMISCEYYVGEDGKPVSIYENK